MILPAIVTYLMKNPTCKLRILTPEFTPTPPGLGPALPQLTTAIPLPNTQEFLLVSKILTLPTSLAGEVLPKVPNRYIHITDTDHQERRQELNLTTLGHMLNQLKTNTRTSAQKEKEESEG
ncbi:hypothetical protein QQ045_007218 [Rhodiola kirilowii]